MQFNDLLKLSQIESGDVLVMRHRPKEPKLNRVIRWMAAERHDVFNAYQQTQGKRVEKAMLGGVKYVASFIGHSPGKAIFVGLYKIGGNSPLTFEDYWSVPANQELKKLDHEGFTKEQADIDHRHLQNDERARNYRFFL